MVNIYHSIVILPWRSIIYIALKDMMAAWFPDDY